MGTLRIDFASDKLGFRTNTHATCLDIDFFLDFWLIQGARAYVRFKEHMFNLVQNLNQIASLSSKIYLDIQELILQRLAWKIKFEYIYII